MRCTSGAIGAIAGLTLLSLSTGAFAQGFGTAIAPGSTNVTFSSASNLGNTVPGTSTLLATMMGAFDTGANGGTEIAGTYTSEVYRETGGTLDFYYQFTNNPTTSNGSIFSFGVSNFKNISAAVGYTTSAVGSTVASSYGTGGPDFANETSGTINTIAFDFSTLATGGVAPGATSVTMLVSTNATIFTTSNATFTGAVAANGTVYAPSLASAPEPAALALILPGVLGVVGFARRRKNA